MLSNLRAEMARKKITGTDIGVCIGRSQKSVFNKINEHSDFTRKEMFLIKANLFPESDMRYLFESDNDLS
ncbi:MAG: hypothetical protein ACLSGN_06800 [Oscillospiraceae bacterium]